MSVVCFEVKERQNSTFYKLENPPRDIKQNADNACKGSCELSRQFQLGIITGNYQLANLEIYAFAR